MTAPLTDLIAVAKVKMDALERDIEGAVCKYAVTRGMLHYKFTSPARAAVPDRLFINQHGKAFMVEFKRHGKKPTPAQDREIAKLRAQNVNVFVVDNVDDGRAVVDMMV